MRKYNEPSSIKTEEERIMLQNILEDIVSERERQIKKWDRKWGEWNASLDKKNTVLVEEVGEVAMALNDNEPVEDLRKELVQVAAVCMAWIETLDSSS